MLLLHARADSVKAELNDEIESLRHDIERRAYRLEVRVAAWGATASMLLVCVVFLLIGLWLGLSELMGPLGASFVLAALFGMLAAIPMLLLPGELAHMGAPVPPQVK